MSEHFDDPPPQRTPTEVRQLQLVLTVTEAPDGTRSYDASYEFLYHDADGLPMQDTRRSGDAIPHLSAEAKAAGKAVADEALDKAQATLA